MPGAAGGVVRALRDRSWTHDRSDRRPGRRPRRRPRPPPTRSQDALALRDREALRVLRREVDRLVTPQRRGVRAGLDAGVVRIKPTTGGQPQRELVGKFVNRWIERNHAERRLGALFARIL